VKRHKVRLPLAVGFVVLTGALYPLGVSAQEPAQPSTLAPAGLLTVDRATVVNVATAGALEAPAPPAGVSINRPTIPLDQYRALKRQAALAPQAATRPGATGAVTPRATVGVNTSGARPEPGRPRRELDAAR
jgi:hypothetical protein